MSKAQLIDAIRRHNRTAHEDYLVGFNEQALTNYLEHLRYKLAPKQDGSPWIRSGETTAVVTRMH